MANKWELGAKLESSLRTDVRQKESVSFILSVHSRGLFNDAGPISQISSFIFMRDVKLIV